MEITIDDNGNIQIGIAELIEQMTDDDKQHMIEHFAWQSPIWKELVHGACEAYAGGNFNSDIFEMRKEFFQSEFAPEVLRQTMASLLTTIKHLQQQKQAYTSALGKWRKWYGDHMPATRQPVPFPRWDINLVRPHEVTAFMERNHLSDLFEAATEL